jgi:hypothetical protein
MAGGKPLALLLGGSGDVLSGGGAYVLTKTLLRQRFGVSDQRPILARYLGTLAA